MIEIESDTAFARIDVSVTCQECGAGLDAEYAKDHRCQGVVLVSPCANCIEDAERRGRMDS